MLINSTNDFLALCYPREQGQRAITGRELHLVYLNIDNKLIQPVSTLMNLGSIHKPRSVKVHIARNYNSETYNMIAVVLYDIRIMISRCEYFKIYGVVPYIVNNRLDYNRRDIISSIQRMLHTYIIERPCNTWDVDTSNLPPIYDRLETLVERKPYQPLIQGEGDSECSIKNVIRDYEFLRKAAAVIPSDVRSMLNERYKSNKMLENIDTTPRSSLNVELILKHKIEGIKNIILYGDNGLGKTSLAKFYLGYKCLVVHNIDVDLGKFDDRIHDSILFENIDFRDRDPLYVLNLVCCPNRVVQCGDVNVLIPTDTELVFTTNINDGKIFHRDVNIIYFSCCKIAITSKTWND